jgi:hypothetical protein
MAHKKLTESVWMTEIHIMLARMVVDELRQAVEPIVQKIEAIYREYPHLRPELMEVRQNQPAPKGSKRKNYRRPNLASVNKEIAEIKRITDAPHHKPKRKLTKEHLAALAAGRRRHHRAQRKKKLGSLD